MKSSCSACSQFISLIALVIESGSPISTRYRYLPPPGGPRVLQPSLNGVVLESVGYKVVERVCAPRTEGKQKTKRKEVGADVRGVNWEVDVD